MAKRIQYKNYTLENVGLSWYLLKDGEAFWLADSLAGAKRRINSHWKA